MRVAIVGSRYYPDLLEVRRYVATLKAGAERVEILTGDATGVDATVQAACRAVGLRCHVFPADWSKHGRSAGVIRNQAVVRAADMVVVFWDGHSAGTRFTIAEAERQQVPTTVLPSIHVASRGGAARGAQVTGDGSSIPGGRNG